ncbi:MAG: hypothetical protein KDK40_04785, partial [Chlamydiia bacterium]|nr:hypothetical protein [Chlamydiia bacterium]
YSWMGFVISKPEDLLIGSQVPIPDPENPNLTMVGFPSKIKLTDAPPYNGAVITVVSGGSGAIGSWMDGAVVKIPAGTFGTKVDGTPVPPNDIDEYPLRDVDEIINQQDNPTFLGGTFTNLKDAVKAYGVNAPWLPASQRGDYASTVTPDEGNDDLFALFADWGPSNDESHVFNNPSQYFYKEDNSKFNFYPDNLKILALNQLGYTQEQINEIIGTTEPGSDNGFWKVVAVPTDGKTFPTILPGDANKSIPDILDDAFKNPVTVSVILGNRSPQDVLRDVQAARLELAKQLSILDKLNPPQIDPTTKLPQRDPNSLAGKIATVLSDLNNLMGGVDANLYPYKFERDASGNIIYDANGQPVLQYQKNTDGSFKLDASGQKIPVLSDAFEGLKKWLIDNRNAAFGDTGADQTGKFQENVTNALTAASNLNDTQKETFRRYMFVFEEYYKSASAILNAINQLLSKMAQNISR